MTGAASRIGIVGSGIAGLRAAQSVLACESGARITVFGEETHRTYNRPGLTKKRYPSLADFRAAMVADLTVKGAETSAIDWRLGTRVESADLRDRVLRLGTGGTFAYDGLVVAAGVRPRTVARHDEACASHTHRTLRGLDDAHSIHQELRRREAVTIAGAGFVACELASLAKEYGCHVVMLEARRHGPFENLLGEEVARTLGRWVTANGVTLLTGEAAKELLCVRAGTCSRDEHPASPLETESERPLLIEAVGSVPNVEWLVGNGLDLSDGVRVDEYMRVMECEGVFAAGDIARYPDPWATAKLTRMEFWKNAIETGMVAGKALASSLGFGTPMARIGYFPSMTTEVFGLRIQIAGNPKSANSMMVVRGDLERPGDGVLVTYVREGVIVGAAYLDTGARFNQLYIELVRSLKAC